MTIEQAAKALRHAQLIDRQRDGMLQRAAKRSANNALVVLRAEIARCGAKP